MTPNRTNRLAAFRRLPLAWLPIAWLPLSGAALAQLAPPASPAPVADIEYDANGNRTRVVRAAGSLGLVERRAYDRLDRPQDSTDGTAGTTRFTYTGRDALSQVTDPRGLVTRYPRNGLGDATALVSPDTGTATHTHDAAGNLLTRTDSRGVTERYTHDALGRLTTVTYSRPGEPSRVHAWTYDQTGAEFGHGIGRLTSTAYPGGSTRHAHDALGRVIATTQFHDAGNGAGVGLTVGYGYDAAGGLTSVRYPSGRVLSIGRIGGLPSWVALADSATSTSTLLVSQIQHEPAPGGIGPARSWRWHFNGGPQLHERVFDLSGRMVRHPLGGAIRDLHYDEADRIVAYTHLDRATGSATAATRALDQTFGYDAADRLTAVNTSIAAWTFGYDANGNRAWAQLSGGAGNGTRQYTLDAASNRLLGHDNPSRSYAHDVAGNVVDDQSAALGRQVTVDLTGRVSRIVRRNAAGTLETSYAYNTFGLRVFKSAGGSGGSAQLPSPGNPCPAPAPGPEPMRASSLQTFSPIVCLDGDAGLVAAPAGTLYVHDPDGRLLGEYDAATGAAQREYVWLHAMPLAVIAHEQATPSNPTPVFFIQADHLDTPRVVLDRNGAQRWSWIAEPFGNGSPNENPIGAGTFTLNLRMPGQYFDVESGLSQNWHRDYDAEVGRYTQSDPIGLLAGINPYVFVDGNPVANIDPTGEFAWVGAGAGAGLNFGSQMGMCLALGGDLSTCLKCVDYLDVGLSAIKGYMGVGFLQVARSWKDAAKAEAALERLMGPIGPAVAKAQRRALTERFAMETAATKAAKATTPPVNFCEEDTCRRFKLMRLISVVF